MTTAYFPGDSRYYAVLAASRSGFTVQGSLTVYSNAGSYGAWELSNGQAWWAHIAGSATSGTWLYDFRSYSSRRVWTWSRTVSSPGSYTVAGYADMADGKGRARPGNMSVTVPPNAPAAPDTPTITRVSDTNQTVSWTRRATAAAPYSSQQVQRREYSGSSWSGWTGISTLSTNYSNSGSHSITDTSSVANKQYEYRVKAANGSGERYSGVSGSVFTTPASPTSIVAEKQASGSISLTLVQSVPHPSNQTTLEYSMDSGATWDPLTTLSPGEVSYLWVSPPPGASVVFRGSVEVDSPGSVGDGLVSDWKLSNVVPLTAPPNPPSNLSPNGVAFNADEDRLMMWNHNSVDSSSQTAYELRIRVSGSSSWVVETGKVASNVTSYLLTQGTLANGASFQWQTRTWGAHEDPSSWSPLATFSASAPPSVSIISPDTTLEAAKVLVSWTFHDPEGSAQSMWEAQLSLQGSVLETRSGSGATSSVQFNTRLTDATEYQVVVRGRDGVALWSPWDQRTFVTDFPLPPTPELTLSWNTIMGSVSASVVNPEGVPEVISNEIFRSLDEGQTWTLVEEAPVNGMGFDPEVPLGLSSVLYKVISWTSLPSSSESEVESISTVGTIGYWSVGAMFEHVLQLRINQGNPPKIDLTTGIYDKTRHYFAGRTLPVETTGEAREVSGSVEFVVPTLVERDLSRSMALLPAPHLFRLPDGTTLFCSIDPVSETRLEDGWYQLSFDVIEVDR